MSAADAVLDKAYRILSEEKGWCQGHAAITPLGPVETASAIRRTPIERVEAVCAWGALAYAARRLRCSYVPALRRVWVALDTGQLGAWNDAPERTVEDVLLVIKRARYDVTDEAALAWVQP